MATDQVDESRDVGTQLHGARQVIEMIATGAPPAAVLEVLCRVTLLANAAAALITSHTDDHVLGTAVCPRAQVFVSDVNSDPLFETFRELASAKNGNPVAEVDLELPERFDRLPLDTETALFRGGRLEITSGDHGTTVRARVPLVKDPG